jgi:hypothetical protein
MDGEAWGESYLAVVSRGGLRVAGACYEWAECGNGKSVTVTPGGPLCGAPLPPVDPSRRPKAGKYGRFCTLKPSHGASQAVPWALGWWAVRRVRSGGEEP